MYKVKLILQKDDIQTNITILTQSLNSKKINTLLNKALQFFRFSSVFITQIDVKSIFAGIITESKRQNSSVNTVTNRNIQHTFVGN